MSAPTADLPRISRYTASRDQPCTSGQDCAGVKAGEKAAYVGWTTGSGAVCGPCLDELDRNVASATGEQPAADPLGDGPMPADPFLPEGNPLEPQVVDALVEASQHPAVVLPLARIDDVQRRELAGRGLILRTDAGIWHLTDTGRQLAAKLAPSAPALPEGDDPAEEPQTEGGLDHDARSALDALRITAGDYDFADKADQKQFRGLVDDVLEHLDDDTVSAIAASEHVEVGETRTVTLDRLAALLAAAHGKALEVGECECKRVTSRAKFGRTPDGRPTHEHCGGVLREKHQHLALAANPENTETTPEPTEAQTDDRDDAAGDQPADSAPAADPGADPGAGVEARSADGAAGAGEAGGEGGDGAGEGDHGGDQGGDVPAGPRGGDHPEPVRDEAVEAGADGAVDVRLDGVQEVAAGRVGPVGEEVGELAPGRDGLTGLAAFYSQPEVEDDDQAPGAGSLAAFYSQPDDEALTEDELAQGVAAAAAYSSNYGDYGRPFTAPDSDNYLDEFSVAELAGEIARRDNIGAASTRVAGVLMVDEAHGVEWIVRVPR